MGGFQLAQCASVSLANCIALFCLEIGKYRSYRNDTLLIDIYAYIPGGKDGNQETFSQSVKKHSKILKVCTAYSDSIKFYVSNVQVKATTKPMKFVCFIHRQSRIFLVGKNIDTQEKCSRTIEINKTA